MQSTEPGTAPLSQTRQKSKTQQREEGRGMIVSDLDRMTQKGPTTKKSE